MCDLENRVASAPAREVGGEFAQPLAEDFLIPSPRRVPRAPGTATAHYTASGRQALSLIARALRDLGVRRVGMPNYFCWTMAEPLELEGLGIDYLKVGEDLLPEPAHVAAYGRGSSQPSAVLVATTFGNQPGEDLLRALEAFTARGGYVIGDLTHDVPSYWQLPEARPYFDEPHSPRLLDRQLPAARPRWANFALASLRKWVPIPDGAWALGENLPASGARGAIEETASSLAWRRIQTGENNAAEDAVDAAISPVSISTRAAGILCRVAWEGIARARRANARTLARCLAEAGVTGGARAGGAPAGGSQAESSARSKIPRIISTGCYALALSWPEGAASAAAASAALAEEGIYTPAYWPPLTASPAWPGVLALPIDQRYGAADMAVVARAVAKVRASLPSRRHSRED